MDKNETPLDDVLQKGLVREATPLEYSLEEAEEMRMYKNKTLKKIAQRYVTVQIMCAENEEAKVPKGEAFEYLRELEELSIRYKLKVEEVLLTEIEIKGIENELIRLARKYGIPDEVEGWDNN